VSSNCDGIAPPAGIRRSPAPPMGRLGAMSTDRRVSPQMVTGVSPLVVTGCHLRWCKGCHLRWCTEQTIRTDQLTHRGFPVSGGPKNPAVSSRLRAIARGAITTRGKGVLLNNFWRRRIFASSLDSALSTLARSSGAGRHDQIMSRPPAKQPDRDTTATCGKFCRVYMMFRYDARSMYPLVNNSMRASRTSPSTRLIWELRR
jgi:hypothetical protein